jgi:membrane-associated phospholipid phosphatase
MKQTIAKCISFFGHPLLTIPLFVTITMFATEDIGKAALVTFLIVGCIFVPLIAWLYVKSKNGTTTNFDVSDRKQRKSVFVFILPVLMLVTIILYYTGQSKTVCLSLFFGLVITFVSQLVNLRIKSSLHVSMTIYLAFLIMPLNYIAGIVVLLLSVLIGWSRMVLARHTLKEVLWGGGIGLTVGLVMFFAEQRIYH